MLTILLLEKASIPRRCLYFFWQIGFYKTIHNFVVLSSWVTDIFFSESVSLIL